MKRRRHAFFFVAAVLSTLMAWTGPAFAHGVGWQTDAFPGIAVRFMYDDGEPVMYGEVKIYSPAVADYEYQGGRSDENGYFTFRPNVAGVWRFVADDGQGHMTRGEIEVSEADLSGEVGGTAAPQPVTRGGTQRPGAMQILLGLSILLNIALASLWLQAKRGRAQTALSTESGKE